MINLLPIEQKKEVKREEIFKIFCIFFISILFFLFFLILSLKIFEIKITFEANQLKNEISILKNSQKLIENEIENLENLKEVLPKIIGFEKEKKDFLNQLLEIKNCLVEGIEIENFSMDLKKISISGKAEQRSQLLKLKENLEKNKNFSKVSFSSQSWLKEKDVPFSVSFEIKSWSSEKK